ncbi:ABC transporter substrate-binding protein [Halobacteria archaeon AArc-m2/3/4]|uniref:ABC transporter substrate-binding protein n=1 Tax=Natronoglomus mannanivorans TaxID=2979990 RepID=A0ABT2QBG2_9EURY|nr:ABC transporter substrate-binding protein [Halobacteria archaeon AArc-m2/3/4]
MGGAVSTSFLLGYSGQVGAQEGDGSIHITQQVEPAQDYDPVVLNDAYSARIANHIYDGLYEFGPELEIEPKVAVGEPEVEEDGMRYIVEIEDGIEFHNGDPLTAEDVLHSFTAPVEEETDNAPTFDMIDIEASDTIDEHTVQFDLLEPYGPFPTMTLATNIVNMDLRLEEEDVDPAERSYNVDDPVGSGPYQYVDHAEGEFFDMVRWDDYWDEPLPNVEEVRWVATEDDAARTAQIRAGDTDFITGIPPADYELLDGEDGVEVYNTPSISYFYIAFNCNDGPTQEPEVRNAIDHTFSASAFIDDIIGELGENAVAPMGPSVLEEWGFPADEYAEMENEYDPEQAAEMMEGHVPDGWEPELIAPPDDIRIALMERVAARLGEMTQFGVDINPQVRSLSWGEFLDRYTTGDADDYAAYTLGWTGHNDPDAYYWALFHEENEGVTQGHYYDNSEFHQTIRDARETFDEDERFDLYDQATRMLLEDKVHIPAYSIHNSIAALPHVEDLEVHPHSSIKPRLVSDHHNVDV